MKRSVSGKHKTGLTTGSVPAILENAGAVIFMCDQKGHINFVNPAFCQTVGLTDDMLLGKNVRFIYPGADLTDIQNTLADSTVWQNELEYRAPNGTSFWFHTNITQNGDNFIWVQMDVTAQKEESFRQINNEKKLQSILDHIPAYVFSKNRKGEYTYVNHMLAALHALKSDEVLGKTDYDLFPFQAAESFEKNDRTVFEQHKTVRALEDGGRDEYGIERCYLSVKCPMENEQGEVDELLGMSIDISEQQRLEKALWASQEKLNSILDNMKARVYIKDTDLRYTYANEELCQILNMDRTSITGKNDFDLFEPETAVGFRTTDQEALKTKQKISRMETSVDTQTRTKSYYWSVKVPLLTAEGDVHSILGISTDVTEQKRLEQKLQANERQLTTILDNMKAHVYIKDTSYTYTYVNADMCEYLGKTFDEIVGKTDAEIFGESVAERFHQSDTQVFNYRENCTSIEKSRHYRTGKSCYFLSIKAPLINDVGNAHALIGISTDVTEQQRMERELRKMASTDVLTGANNRRHFLELCEKEMDRAKRYGHNLSLIMLDVDHFKHINDTYGHATGDEAIRSMTKLCRDSLRNSDVLGRIGGEEFAILLPETDLIGAWQIAQRIRQNTEDFAFDTGQGKIDGFTASFGLTGLLEKDQNPDDLLKRADIALYDAKTQGRNRVCEKID
ncbi:sensor domain-containing diguanylate cyclase [Terasakiella brassicae]|uniref:sensor domain-containing diguanylate cyclase n=1 Tax=Terasakiella brassicae TaxID=1634917 RepID=UPI00227D64A9|nr:PAS domain-containing protein [Terasakiella brassicae]